MINLGGEQETPEFEYYQVTLGFSGYAKPHTGMKAVFRPIHDDSDASVRIAPKTASHICMRGTPLFPPFVKAINDIAQAGCFFTFAGTKDMADTAIKELGGTVLEQIAEGVVIKL